ncbi:MAG: RNA polymerase sigma factor [Chloroflexi bacterium]|nr:MAG: RNA polymerase sigma factor [Chloroflexota bacterium]
MEVLVAPAREDAAAGDQDAFMALVEPLLPSAHRLAVAMLRSNTDAEDAVQEAVLRAWRGFGKFRRDSVMRPWLLTIVANECKRQRRSRWLGVLDGPKVLESETQLSPAEPSAAADLRRAIHKLPTDQRLAITLRYYLDLPFGEVAQVLRISPKAAKSRTYRALERLRMSPEVMKDE